MFHPDSSVGRALTTVISFGEIPEWFKGHRLIAQWVRAASSGKRGFESGLDLRLRAPVYFI